jgi:hypothetical protein
MDVVSETQVYLGKILIICAVMLPIRICIFTFFRSFLVQILSLSLSLFFSLCGLNFRG